MWRIRWIYFSTVSWGMNINQIKSTALLQILSRDLLYSSGEGLTLTSHPKQTPLTGDSDTIMRLIGVWHETTNCWLSARTILLSQPSHTIEMLIHNSRPGRTFSVAQMWQCSIFHSNGQIPAMFYWITSVFILLIGARQKLAWGCSTLTWQRIIQQQREKTSVLPIWWELSEGELC